MTKQRIKSIESHIAADDYFGTLATVLDLLRQDMVELGGKQAHAALVGYPRDDLLYLQQNYRIKHKNPRSAMAAFLLGSPTKMRQLQYCQLRTKDHEPI